MGLKAVATPGNVADTNDGVIETAGKKSIWIPASAMTPSTTNGAAAGQIETTTNKQNIEVLDFDATTQEHACFSVALPKSWNEGTVTYKVFWTSDGAVTTGVTWSLQGISYADSDAPDAAYGTAVDVEDDAQGTAGDIYVTSESTAVTIAGSPAESEIQHFRIFRDVADDNDDMVQDARLIGIQLFITTNATNDA